MYALQPSGAQDTFRYPKLKLQTPSPTQIPYGFNDLNPFLTRVGRQSPTQISLLVRLGHVARPRFYFHYHIVICLKLCEKGNKGYVQKAPWLQPDVCATKSLSCTRWPKTSHKPLVSVQRKPLLFVGLSQGKTCDASHYVGHILDWIYSIWRATKNCRGFREKIFWFFVQLILDKR